MTFLDRLLRGLTTLCRPGQRVLLAVSGGPDSIALLAGVHRLALPWLQVEVATLDHQLRPGSAADGAYVARLCRRWGVPCVQQRIVVGSGSGLEAEARLARYRALEAIADERGCDLVATGHTLEDQAETVLLRLARGAGTRGLRGILPARGRVIRPMLEASRAEVAEFLRKERLRPRLDPTNRSPRHDRNRVRAQVLPALERALGPAAVRGLARTAAVARDDDEYLEDQARQAFALEVRGDARGGSLERFRSLVPALRHRVVLRAAAEAGLEPDFEHVQAVEAALLDGGPRRLSLPGGELRIRGEFFELGPVTPTRGPPEATQTLISGPGQYQVEGCSLVVREVGRKCSTHAIRVDPQTVSLPLVLRRRRPGDRFHRAGSTGSKKLKAFLIDQKVDRIERDRLWLLCDAQGEVLWIVGKWKSNRVVAEAGPNAWEVSAASRSGGRSLEKGRVRRDQKIQTGE